MPFTGEPLTHDQIIAKRSLVRKGAFMTSEPRFVTRERPPELDTSVLDELQRRLRAVKQKIEDLKAGNLP